MDDAPKPIVLRIVCILALAAVLASLLGVTFVFDWPKVRDDFMSLNVPLPGATILAIRILEVLRTAWWFFAALLLALAAAVAVGALDDYLGVVLIVAVLLLLFVLLLVPAIRLPLQNLQRSLK